MKIFKRLSLVLFGLLVVLQLTGQKVNAAVTKVDFDNVTLKTVLTQKHGVMGTKLDENKRPFKMRIVLQDKDEVGKRVGAPAIPSNLRSWLHNYKVTDTVKGEQYIWNRGHGIGNQFGGSVSNDGDNIAAETVYLNQVLMLHYEGSTNTPNTLDNWLHETPDKYLDYLVTFNYTSAGDQIPTSVTLGYRGVDKDGNVEYIKITPDTRMGSGAQTKTTNGFTVVTLQNIQPNYQFSYVDGQIVKDKSKQHAGWKEDTSDVADTYGDATSSKSATEDTSDGGGFISNLFGGGSMSVLFLGGIIVIAIIMFFMDEYHQ